MYEEHPKFNAPELEAVLWRYMDFTKFVALLDTGCLYFVRSDALGDPFEGSYPELNVALRSHRYPDELVRQLPSVTQDTRRTMFISCWHESSRESAAMWRLYSREHDGIAIQTTFQLFRDCLIGAESVFVGKVDYIDYNDSLIDEDNAFGPYMYKRREFEHEREVRAIRWIRSSSEDSSALDVASPPKGLLHGVDLSILIKGIVVAPYAEDWFADLVRSVAGRYGLGDYVYTSSLAASPSW